MWRALQAFTAEDAKIAKKISPQISQMNADQEKLTTKDTKEHKEKDDGKKQPASAGTKQKRRVEQRLWVRDRKIDIEQISVDPCKSVVRS